MESVLATPKEQLLARLDDPDVIDSLNRFLDQLPLLNFGAEALNGFIKRGDTIAGNVASGFSDLRDTVGMPDGPSFERIAGNIPGLMKTGAQLANAATTPAMSNLLSQGLLEELGKPETIDLFKRLLDKLELIVFAVEATDGFIRRSDSIIEGIRESVRDASALLPDQETLSHLQDLAASAPHLIEAASNMVDGGMVEKLQQLSEASDRLIASGLLEPAKMTMLADMGSVLTETLEANQKQAAQGKPARVGMFGLLSAMGDPDVQASMGMLIEFSKRYGAKLASNKGAGGA